MDVPADEVLLERIARRDEDEFSLFYDRHASLAYSVAYRIMGERPGAEAVLQDAFVNLWRRANSYDGKRGNAQAWLLSIVRHRAIDAIRNRSRQPTLGLHDDYDQPLFSTDDVWKNVANRLDRQAIVQALARIPWEQRQVIEMAFFDGLTHTEIAQRKQLPLGTVKSRIRIGMKKLRDLLVAGGTGA